MITSAGRVVLDGTCELENHVDGEVENVIVVTHLDYYGGPYEFVPGDEDKVIQVNQLTMADNITIKKVPSNYGKIGWNGSYLTVE